MEMQKVSSSNIAAIGYDSDKEVLIVQFHSGKKYRYSEVPPAVYTGFLEAKSLGIFFSRNIRGNYGYVRLSE